MRLERSSPAKINLILNILGKRPDGFHELETVMQPVGVCDTLTAERIAQPGIHLTCSEPRLPVDSSNLVHRAASLFLAEVGDSEAGVRVHLEKRIPMAAGLGGGSSNAAATLLLLNECFEQALSPEQIRRIAAALGSDVPFFLQSGPALATGRGEIVEPLDPFPALLGKAVLLIHPGFGVATAWSYRALAEFPTDQNGERGRAGRLINLLQARDLRAASHEFYNSLEAPVLEKYPVLSLYQEFLRERGAIVTRMSGSGSSTFAVFQDLTAANAAIPDFRDRFGSSGWISTVTL